jgi:uncharacterized membrane protein YphA (DoxX/SURF4 family)
MNAMNVLLELASVHAALGRVLDHLRSVALLVTRLYLGWIFWHSGSGVALLCTALLVPGIFTRIGALGALAAVVSMVLTPDINATFLWAFMASVLMVSGAGIFSVDTWLERRLARRCRPFMAAPPA